MKDLRETWQSEAASEAVIRGKKWRITVLTEELLRLEYQEDGIFEDLPTQRVVNRLFPVPEFTFSEKEGIMELKTAGLTLTYTGEAFSRQALSIRIFGNGISSVWRFGDEPKDLLGTARTLDTVNGSNVTLEHGLMSRTQGYSVLDDSTSVALKEDGWFRPRKAFGTDLYFFGYGHAYSRCLKDFYRLTGNTPLVPRFVLGNWWSRYYKYTEQTYMDMISRFEAEKIPLTVGIIDMDWHLVKIDPKYGSGWTGYTWNKEFFPDYRRFLKWMHAHGLKTALNLHPADGIRGFEEQYPIMAETMGVDAAHEEPVKFDMTNRKFIKAIFDHVYHPYEKDGVDFWWLDWQQGNVTGIPGLDPLWLLNHFHYEDLAENHSRGLTFSRYAGPGSHRYPIGFSGDTVMTWESLDFQPYFTANASNIGYGWWSHDIGGHMMGYRDDELLIRWIQFGVFSPVMRLHSSNNIFLNKEPWMLRPTERTIYGRFLRLRHAMIPYLYSMNVLANRDAQPLLRPMYYENPEENDAYRVPNEYYFGNELIACPITKKMASTRLSGCRAYLPEGIWYDVFLDRVYQGGRMLDLYRGLENIPVFAHAGAIIPFADPEGFTNSVENPDRMLLKVYTGADGSFHLYEDDGTGRDFDPQNFADTFIEWNQEKRVLKIHAVSGNASVIPEKRTWHIEFHSGGSAGMISEIREDVPVTEEISIQLSGSVEPNKNDFVYEAERLLLQVEYDNTKKLHAFNYIKNGKSIPQILTNLQSLVHIARFGGQQGRILRTRRAILYGQF